MRSSGISFPVPATAALLAVAGLLAVACGGANAPVPTPDRASRVVSFVTEDGVELKGRLFGDQPTGVVLAHMFPADQTSWWEFAKVLGSQGFMTLTFDFRGYGDSGGDKKIELIDRDVNAAVSFLRGQGATKVFLVGASMGGTASLKVASQGQVAGVVSLSAPLEFRGVSVKDAEIRVPVLLMASEDDQGAENSLRELMEKGIVGGPGLTQSVVYEDSGDHGTNMIRPGARHETAAKERILSFLKANSQ